MKLRYVLGIIVVLCIIIGVGYEYTLALKRKLADKEIERVAAVMKAEGFQEALAAKPKEIIKLVPTLVTKTITKLIKEGKVAPVAAAAIEASTDIVIPCPPSADPNAPPPAEVPLHLTFTANLLITRIKFGIATEWKGDLGGSWERPGAPPQPFAFKPEDTRINVAFSDEIAQALLEHEREGGWLKRRTALACPIAGISYDPFTRQISPAFACGFGFVWF